MAENHTIEMSIITPNGIVAHAENIRMAVMKSLSGELGIMYDHQPIVAALKISELHTIDENDKKEIYAINGGFAEFNNNILTVVVDSAEAATDIDTFRAERAERRAKEEIQRAQNAEDRMKAQVALARAINRLEIAKMK